MFGRAAAWVRVCGLRPLGGRQSVSLRVTVPVPLEYAAELATTASALVAPGKGLLASDESPATLTARLESAGLSNDEDTRRGRSGKCCRWRDDAMQEQQKEYR